MLVLNNNKIEYDYSQCQQCGSCEAVCPKKAISLKRLDNGLCNINIDQEKCILCKRCISVCPATMQTIGQEGYIQSLRNKKYCFAYNKDNDIRRNSSSGGACKTLIIDSLISGLVDGVYTLRKCSEYPFAEGAFYTKENVPSFDDMPNSVYHSVMLGRNLNEVRKCDRLMLVGTSCQLRSLEKALKGKYNELIKVCIFCKQQKTLDSTRFLAKAMGTAVPENLKFSTRYRGEGWPGIVRVGESELPYSRAAQIPFGRRLWTVPGCNVCGDPFGMECDSDISLMDPWIIRKENELGETLVTVHSEKGLRLLESADNLIKEKKNYKEIEPALGLVDIERKRRLVPFFRGVMCNQKEKMAGRAEQLQRKYLQFITMKLPRMPFVVYRIMAHFPDLRNLILK